VPSARKSALRQAFVRLRRPSHFSLLGQRKVTQREATPLGAFRASCPESACGMAWLFDGTSVCRRKGIGIVPIPLRAWRPRLTAAQGPRRAARILRALLEKPYQTHAVVFRFALAAAGRLRTECEPGRLAALPGPLCGGETGATGRAAGIDRKSMPFRRYMEVPAKSPPPAHGLFAHGWAKSTKRGAPLLGYFLSGKREKVTRAPKAHESFSNHRKAPRLPLPKQTRSIAPRLARRRVCPEHHPNPR